MELFSDLRFQLEIPQLKRRTPAPNISAMLCRGAHEFTQSLDQFLGVLRRQFPQSLDQLIPLLFGQ